MGVCLPDIGQILKWALHGTLRQQNSSLPKDIVTILVEEAARSIRAAQRHHSTAFGTML